jgi:hypothetical protein
MIRSFLATATLTALLASAAPAQAPAPVDCGSVTCFQIRVPAEGKQPDARAGEAMNVINKYLGGKVGKVTTKPAGKNVAILLNNERVVLVTPADADAEKQKTVAALAARWSALLTRAFESTKAQK